MKITSSVPGYPLSSCCMKILSPQELARENSKRLKSLFSHSLPYFSSSRFLLKINGIKKIWLPSTMRQLPLIRKLIKYKSLSDFKRSLFFRQNFHSVSNFFLTLHNLRLRHDFLYWVSQVYSQFSSMKIYPSLVAKFQKIHQSEKPIRLLIRKNYNQSLIELINLFVIWSKAFAPKGLNIMSVAPTTELAVKSRRFFRQWSESADSSVFRFTKSNRLISSAFPSINSKVWFIASSRPDNCRGLNYSYLILSDMHKWNNAEKSPARKVFQASFPVIPDSLDSAIIMESGPSNLRSIFNEEWRATKKGCSPFDTYSIPWYEDLQNIFRFDFPEEKYRFYKKLIKNCNLAIFPPFRNVSGKYLYSLWQSGLPLESLYWYLTESSFYKSRKKFLLRFPSILLH